MELHEAIEQINTGLKDFCFNPNFEEAIRKVVGVAEQVEGVEGISDEKIDYNTCSICGADSWLHQAESELCPRFGREAPVGRKQEWEDTVFTPTGHDAHLRNQANSQWRALIVGKLEKVEGIIQKVFTKHARTPFCPEGKEVRFSEISTAIRALFLGEK